MYLSQYGLVRVWHMVRHAVDVYTDLIKTCQEDVVICGHTHRKALQTLPGGNNGDVIYANEGSWLDNSGTVRMPISSKLSKQIWIVGT